jgi:hypothetical protein
MSTKVAYLYDALAQTESWIARYEQEKRLVWRRDRTKKEKRENKMKKKGINWLYKSGASRNPTMRDAW